MATVNLEDRVAALEAEVARLRGKLEEPGKPWGSRSPAPLPTTRCTRERCGWGESTGGRCVPRRRSEAAETLG